SQVGQPRPGRPDRDHGHRIARPPLPRSHRGPARRHRRGQEAARSGEGRLSWRPPACSCLGDATRSGYAGSWRLQRDWQVPVDDHPSAGSCVFHMKELVLTYPDDLAQAIQLTAGELPAQLRLMASLKMFELGKLSSGKAAELAGLSRGEFFEACGRYRVSI